MWTQSGCGDPKKSHCYRKGHNPNDRAKASRDDGEGLDLTGCWGSTFPLYLAFVDSILSVEDLSIFHSGPEGYALILCLQQKSRRGGSQIWFPFSFSNILINFPKASFHRLGDFDLNCSPGLKAWLNNHCHLTSVCARPCTKHSHSLVCSPGSLLKGIFTGTQWHQDTPKSGKQQNIKTGWFPKHRFLILS